MPWTQKQMLRDANGDLIPQYWDVAEQEFKPLTGSNGANDVRLTGRRVVEEVIPRGVYSTLVSSEIRLETPEWASKLIVEIRIYGMTGTNINIQPFALLRGHINGDMLAIHGNADSPTRMFFIFGESDKLGDLAPLQNRVVKTTPIAPTSNTRVYVDITGDFDVGQGVDLEVIYIWQS